MNVLSLFDGMSCGQIALNRVGFEIENFYASEIDKHAIQITQKNYPNTIHIGDVSKVSYKDGTLYTENGEFEVGKIDLIMGGSPCQGFSLVGKQLNFDDPRSKLFFEFIRLVEEVNPKYFLLENVKMKKEYQDIISEYLKVQPIEINSKLVSTQARRRLYWTNIEDVQQPEDKMLNVQSIIDHSYNIPNKEGWQNWWKEKSEWQLKKKYCCILNDSEKGICQTARQMSSWNGNLVRCNNGQIRFATPVECERMQTVPDNYTEGVSNTQRYKMLGNGWTVDVIAHIFKNMKF